MYIINLDHKSKKVKEDKEVLDLWIKYNILRLSNEDSNTSKNYSMINQYFLQSL